jgi:hypothetical protein
VLQHATLAPGASDDSHRGCVFSFRLAAVRPAATYRLQVARRDPLSYTGPALQDTGWRVALNLGLPTPAPARS